MSREESKQHTSLFTGFIFAVLAALLWSGNFIAARGLHHSISPFYLSFFRWAIATVVLFPFAFKKLKAEREKLKGNFLYFSITAFCGVTIFNTFIYIAGRYTSAMNLALIGTTAAPIFVLLITALVLRQAISRFQVIGALLCIAGILILMSGGTVSKIGRLQFSAGDIWILAAALAFAIYTIMVRKKPRDLSAVSFLFILFLLGTLFLLPAFLVDIQYEKSPEWSQVVIWSVLYLGLGASISAFLLWNHSIRILGPSRTALFGNLIPVFSSIEAALILDEAFTGVTLISLLVILAGIMIANFTKRK